jgi:hypothetical protein
MKHQWNDDDRGKPEVLGGKRVQVTIYPQKNTSKGMEWVYTRVSAVKAWQCHDKHVTV